MRRCESLPSTQMWGEGRDEGDFVAQEAMRGNRENLAVAESLFRKAGAIGPFGNAVPSRTGSCTKIEGAPSYGGIVSHATGRMTRYFQGLRPLHL